ncbi:FxSxx-COOH system tetratricopeptide repeat protein [Streptomyces halstedii]|uniref:FxSxx-COOH system tetratricopeptide repeat protein n=1 Tax=Streptomyces TaxID=1883 RepID=UPI00048B77A9|nr:MULTISPECIES: FxSxx-COOH system tetratricopeptide repeat protein [Streptomyces]KDQ66356.1 ATP/GTP-binding protein [Streptomyces sp. NTK 937]MYR74148.1 tetratricopeptide repeat protein [Streptomyces sp. SID4925]MYY19186.1 tetratricopeptide repeat protein [Streptomyces sp. SID4912]SBU91959.1 MinD-like ATPase involved in chromosome partitioning or flagellar assembly [Streptomyces sp. OspMP-M45]SCE14971.1 MinD-like ATPase involved in chromosome partitioning or flagellar assembly [Streptomyces s
MTAGRDGRIVTFYSYKGGTGRTMALANTAWILAANGKRVLAVDWDLEAPGLHRFFHPFLDPSTLGATTGVIDLITEYAWAATNPAQRAGDWHRDYARVQPHAVSLDPEALGWEFPRGGTLDFVSAGRQNREYSATVSTFDWDNFYDRLGGGHFFDALRDDMKTHYDYVLIDSRTGLSDIADICTVHLPDVLVDCFTLSDQSIDGAASVARQIAERYTGRPISIFPVPMRIDEGEKEKADAGRALARLKFDRLPRDLSGDELTAYWGAVEIPYRPYYAYEETLATFGDEAGLSNSLLSAFERLTAVITDQEVTAMAQMSEEVRLRVRDAFTRRRPALPADLFLSYVAENRMWADWIESVLTRAGFRVVPRDASADPGPEPPARPTPETAARTVVLLSSAYLKSQRAVGLWDRAVAEDPGGGRRRLLPLRISDVRLSAPYIDRNPVDLFRLDEVHATTALMRAVDRPVQLGDGVAPGPRFPGTVPRIWNAPPRNPGFTGRSLVLERMRDQLGGGMAVVLPQPQTLYGLGGVGKTQVALEYVHRFMADYDLVWWISSEQTDDVIAGLAELAVRLGAQGGDDMAAASKEAVDLLRRGVPSDRWLLVFDNADDPERLRRYFPQGGSGHILVTSRNQAWSQHGDALPVDVFLREESVEHLQRRAPGLSERDAAQVATAVGDLPLAVEQAAAWIAETATPIDTYLEQLARQAPEVLALNQPAGYPQPVAATWNISIERLEERSPAAVRLLQLCAFFAPEPISANLLYSKEMIEALKPYDASLQEKLVLGRVIREIGRFALAKVDQVSNSIQVHRLVQAVIRAQLSEEEQAEARHVVHRILAGARPDDTEPIDNPDTWPRFAAIWPHLGPSDARNCRDHETRRLLIDRVRYLWKRGDIRTAATLGDELRETWLEMLGERDIQYLYLCFHLSNILRTRGRYVEAKELDEFTLRTQREVLGPEHPHTYMTTSSLAIDLGLLGDYGRAIELATEAHDGFNQIFHERHARTLAAANNLALNLRSVGQYARAREIDQDCYDLRSEVLGQEHPHSLSSALNLARDLREVGRYEDSVGLLSRTYESLKATLGRTYPTTLSAAKSLAVSLRRAGQLEDARRLTVATRARYRAKYTAANPESLACDLNMAADLFAAGEAAEARTTAQEVVDQYMKVPGERHPYTLAAQNNLGVYLSGSDAPEEAERLLKRVVALMRETFGREHPNTLFCVMNLANATADTGRLEIVLETERTVAGQLREVLGAHHPETLAMTSNLAVTLDALGRPDEARRLRAETGDELARQLGDEHPLTRIARTERRFRRELEPMSV